MSAQARFADQVVWITGASSGIGRELALAFARSGAHVALSARREDRLAEVVAEVMALGRDARAVVCDVTDESQVQSGAAAVERHFGRLDVAVANAGFAVRGRVEQLTAADWRRQMDTNVVGAAVTARHAIPLLRATRGRMVLIGSVAGTLPGPGVSAYTASKAAVAAIGASLSLELKGSGVSCTTILPGYVESEIGRVDSAGVFQPEQEDRMPAWLKWRTDHAARVMLRAIHRREREFVFTSHGRAAAFVGRHLPGLVHLALSSGTLRRRVEQVYD
jgi:NAD(P)-dependent dehydrogenase (short-subunit alcohol dehydrogenase family)